MCKKTRHCGKQLFHMKFNMYVHPTWNVPIVVIFTTLPLKVPFLYKTSRLAQGSKQHIGLT